MQRLEALIMIRNSPEPQIIWDDEKTEKIKSLINNFIKKHRVSCAESVHQCDEPNLESVVLVGDIVDILNPHISYGDDDE